MLLISSVMYVSTLIFYLLRTEHILPGEDILDISLIKLIYHITIPLIITKVIPFVILIQLFYWVMRTNWMFQLCLIHFGPTFHLCRNQIVGFYLRYILKTPVEEWHLASKNQLPGLSVGGTLVENGLINQIFQLILSS